MQGIGEPKAVAEAEAECEEQARIVNAVGLALAEQAVQADKNDTQSNGRLVLIF